MTTEFVPDEFQPPSGLSTEFFLLEPLGPEHNAKDYAAWTSSIGFIHTLPGFNDPESGDSWPKPMSLEENLSDLERHSRDFKERKGFTYTVLDPTSRDVIGCVYIYPTDDPDHDALVESWVSVSHAQLDRPLRKEVTTWLENGWPFESVTYLEE
jgi:hypothetical protein